MANPYEIIRILEQAIAEYTGAPYAVTVDSCTNAIFLACKFVGVQEVVLPAKTYRSVPMAIINAGGKVLFEDIYWRGSYRLNPYPIWDSARRFTSGMYKLHGSGGFECVSFHSTKILHDEQGGAILHSNARAQEWFEEAQFDGRKRGLTTKEYPPRMLAYHCRMSPGVAQRLLGRLSILPRHNEDLPNDDYEDLSQYEIFK